jgi:hypothetical protein
MHDWWLIQRLEQLALFTDEEWFVFEETGLLPLSWALRAARNMERLAEECDEYERKWGEAVDIGVGMAQASAGNILKLILSGCLVKPTVDGDGGVPG